MVWSRFATIVGDDIRPIYHILKECDSIQYGADQGIRWQYVTSHSPWKGGVYERMIQMVKRALRRAVGRRKLSTEKITTTLCEIEAVLNSRPLTYIYDEPDSKVIRPVDFIQPFADIQIPVEEGTNQDDDPDYRPKSEANLLMEQYSKGLETLERFWKIWHEEYLSSLREQHQMFHKGQRSETNREPEVGEVVIIEDENAPRGEWKMGRISEMKHSEDGQIRSAILSTNTREKLERPMSALYPLEVRDDERKKSSVSIEESFRQHPAPSRYRQPDPNLEIEDPEEEMDEGEQISSPLSANSTVMRRFPTMIGMICLLTLTLLQTGAASPQLKRNCSRWTGGALVQLPDMMNGSAIGMKRGTYRRAMADVYSRVPKQIEAFSCAEVTRTVCTRAIFRLSIKVISDELIQTPIAVVDCKEIHKTRLFKSAALSQISSKTWQTKNPTNFSFGWFGTNCYSATNVVLEEGFIIGDEGSHLLTDFGEITGYEIRGGGCVSTSKTVVWNTTTMSSMYPYEKIGTYKAIRGDSHVLIEDLQASFVKASTTTNISDACPFDSPQFMENDIVLTFENARMRRQLLKNNPRSRREKKMLVNNSIRDGNIFLVQEGNETRNVDPENTKFQFLLDKLRVEVKAQMTIVLRENCVTRNMVIQLAHAMIDKDPTYAAMLILREKSVQAKASKHGLLVSPCGNSEKGTVPKDVIFNSGILSRYENRRLSLAMHMMAKKSLLTVGAQGNRTEKAQGLLHSIEETSEELVDQITHEVDMATHEIQNVFDEIVANWRLATAGIIAVIVMLLVTVISFQCNWCGLVTAACLRKKDRRSDKKHNVVDVELIVIGSEKKRVVDTAKEDRKQGEDATGCKNEKREDDPMKKIRGKSEDENSTQCDEKKEDTGMTTFTEREVNPSQSAVLRPPVNVRPSSRAVGQCSFIEAVDFVQPPVPDPVSPGH